MKTVEWRPNTADRSSAEDLRDGLRSPFGRSSKIQGEHLQKLAVVYVRQSSPQQVLENRESTERQYALTDVAGRLGWSADQVLVIDEDQGQSGASAEHRSGFQRLLAEVTMEHVGLVLGLEMSRLARSSKDWHHLLELCAIFGTLLADQDGIYDPSDANDRLLLGLKGTMSEVELHTMRNRLERGRFNKAQRGELFQGVPMGYVLLPNGKPALDPDQQAQSVMRLLFDQFEQLGSLYGVFRYLIRNGIDLPVRPRGGPRKGELQWRRPSLSTLCQILHHPIYAGAYVYGRRPCDVRATYARGKKRKRWKPMEEWKVLIRDSVPSYITWEQYERNQQRLAENRRGNATKGTVRRGAALLHGLIVCGSCGRRMQVSYRHARFPYYDCHKHLVVAAEANCCGLPSGPLDAVVAAQVLRALEPAALELSLRAVEDIEQERRRLDQHWQQKLQRARYEIELAERRYRVVDPNNRLVAATLERQWEESLHDEHQLRDEYDRFQHTAPTKLTAEDRERIVALSASIPALWNAPATTSADRKEIIRCLVDRVVVHPSCSHEYADATIHWKGGFASQNEFMRPVSTYARLRDYEPLMNRVVELRKQGRTASQIATALNREGFHPPKRSAEFNNHTVRRLLELRGLIGNERFCDDLLRNHEWWLVDLARELGMGHNKLRDWTRRGWVHSRYTPIQKYWILWADAEEVQRLKELLSRSRRGICAYATALITPKARPDPPPA